LFLGEEDRQQKKVDDLREQLDDLLPGTRARLTEERLSSLTAEEKQLRDKPIEALSGEDARRWYAIEERVLVTDLDVALRIAREAPEKSKTLAAVMNDLETAERLLRYTRTYKENVNFDFWQLRCDYEQTDNAVAARRAMHDAHEAAQRANLIVAKELYESGFAKWQLVVDEFPELKDEDIVFGDHILESAKRYRDVLDQLTLSLDEKFPFWDLLEKFDQDREFTEDVARHKQAAEEKN
jgi:hypothetical protein